MSIKVFDRTLETLAKSLDLRSQKQVILSTNIANADTPGYQAQTLDFEGALAKALTHEEGVARSGNSEQVEPDQTISNVTGSIYNENNNVVREDGNTVDRDAEMTSLAENQILYNAAVELLRKKTAMIKYAITDGGGH